MAATARTGLMSSQELLPVSHAGAGAQELGPSSAPFPGALTGSWTEMQQLGFKPAHSWDAVPQAAVLPAAP